MVDPAIQEMLDSGAMHETQAPFSADENNFDESENEEQVTIPYTLKLSDPFEFSGKEGLVTEITFQNRVTTKMTMHLSVIGSSIQRGHYVPIVAQMLGKPEEFVKALGPADFSNCINVVMHFF